MPNIKVMHFGLGPIGAAIVRQVAARPGFKIVGAIDIDPAKVGRDLGDIVGLSKRIGVKVSGDAAKALKSARPDVVILCTSSSIKKVLPQIELILKSKIAIVSTTEELSYPNYTHIRQARQVHALAKKAKIVTGSDMPAFFAAKFRANGGNPADSILARFGGSATVGGVKIATVTAMHSNGLDPDFIAGDLGKAMKEAGIWGDVGLATGYVLRFSNGLVAYLSGDTGVTADQQAVVRDLYHAQLVVMNIGDGFTTGPTEAAYVINELVKPASVIASHANEAGTQGGQVRAGSKTESFIKQTKVPVYVPLSGRAMMFDGAGKCTAGC